MRDTISSAQIGVFDSGVGGLSVLRALRQDLPFTSMIYLADQSHVPYGLRSLEEVRKFSTVITRYLISQDSKLIVVACNTASAAALYHLRETFPDIPFVGMEPAVKPAAENTLSKVVGVLATPATFQGELYSSVVEKFASGVHLIQDTCPGLVEQIEQGRLESDETREILENALLPMISQGIDTVVLGCTHYPFVIPLIQEIAGPSVRVIDPSPAVARQAKRLWAKSGLLAAENQGASTHAAGRLAVRVISTGQEKPLEALIPNLIGECWPVEQVDWNFLNQYSAA